jgi:hypothetical protein
VWPSTCVFSEAFDFGIISGSTESLLQRRAELISVKELADLNNGGIVAKFIKTILASINLS